MNPLVELNLALILFIPWFAILGVLFWIYPRRPVRPGRRLFDAASLLLAVLAACVGMYWSMANGDSQFGHMWKQILASTLSYGAFLLVMTVAFLARRRWLASAPSRSAPPPSHSAPEALAP
jgi:peptidoglycan/LPS O-acetylase OafA/YrhL